MPDAEEKISPQPKDNPSLEFLLAAAERGYGIMGLNLSREELEIYANAFNVKKFGPRAATHSR